MGVTHILPQPLHRSPAGQDWKEEFHPQVWGEETSLQILVDFLYGSEDKQKNLSEPPGS